MPNQTSQSSNNNAMPVRQPFSHAGWLLCLALLLPLVVASVSAYWVTMQEESYRATANILILAPNERYIPEQGAAQSVSDWQNADRIVQDARQLLFGEGERTSALMAKVSLSFDAALRTLSIRVTDEDREEAMNNANRLANAYLSRLKARRATQFHDAVDKLATDISAIEFQQVALTARLAPNPVPQLESDAALQTWKEKEAQRIAGVQKSINATDRILNNMRNLHQQAVTKQKYDLLPPEARLLVRASLPEYSIKASALGLFVKTLWISALSMVCLWGIYSLHLRRKSARRSAVRPDLPVSLEKPDVDTRNPIAVDSTSISQLPVPLETVPQVTVPLVTTPQAPVQQAPVAAPSPVHDIMSGTDLDMESVALQIRATGHQRVVLLSESGRWGEQANILMQALMDLDQAVLLVRLGDAGADHAHAGITDLIDQTASYADLVQIDDNTGLHHIARGTRAMRLEDFFSHEFHGLLLALEEACDIVLIDLGSHYDNDYALKSLGIARDALACIDAPDAGESVAQQVRAVIGHFGYQDCLILPLDCKKQLDLIGYEEQEKAIAAE
ncbi:hypothetical protein [Cohaesibacter intestini]|uniref:hypothetical protein n=1 Tax=Cohaesibacter intestini TaxID=2211145 RepID=UPI000DE93B3B|nr:hypothetical protein [Cohaesibacter intestini]